MAKAAGSATNLSAQTSEQKYSICPSIQRRVAVKRCGAVECAVATEKLGSVRSPGELPSGKVCKCDARTELAAPGVPGEQRTGLPIDLRHDERRRGTTRRAEHPLEICGDREPSRSAGP